ncbi:hypothetical protein BDV93DRAFT_521043 [Ceratobasidium sp. AG-I]|nr:hypothetical protein BDV93DRAFT_521043 [Ceratobasidium sp. AG-I]
MTVHKRGLDPALVVVLLSGMARTCSNLSKLCMPFNHSQTPNNSNSSNPPGIRLKDALLTSISQFHNLRVLRSNSTVLDPDILQSLGDFPHLESLIASSQSILDVNDEQNPVTDPALSIQSFPALRHLRIEPISSTMVSRLWRTASFGRNLVSVAIKFRDGAIEYLNSLICDICRGSPLIMELELDLDEIKDFQLSNAVVNHFQQLPLKLVDISGRYTDFQNLIPAFRNVEYLVMEESLVHFEDLVMMSKDMPKLQYLSASLVLWDWSPIPGPPHHSPSPRTCHIDSYFNFGDDFDVEDPEFNNYVELIARALHSLWPKGVRCDFCRLAGAQEESDIDAGIVERINAITTELSGTSALHIPSVAESSSLWMYD